MSAANCLLSEDDFLCSVCLDVFTDPVSTPCGHNFCKHCIATHWNTIVQPQCPVCKEVFYTRPQLRVNTFISAMVAQFRQKTSSSSSEQHVSKETAEAEIQQMIQKKRVKIEEIERSVKISKDEADREKAEGLKVFTALKESIDKGLNELTKEIEDKQTTTEKQAEDSVTELEQEISELTKRSTEVEQLSLSEDHLHLLQRFPSLKAAPPTKDWTRVSVRPPSHEGTVLRAVSQLEETLGKEVKRMKAAELKKVQQFEVDVTLDPDTANHWLVLSDDGKKVHDGEVRKNLPDNPERFGPCACVFGKQSFSSGRFYFEVQVKGKTNWVLGVARESINRKKINTLSPELGYWTIWLRNGNEYEALSDPDVRLSLTSQPDRVGVFVDYEQGLVSFYDVDAAALIFSFTGCSLAAKLRPFFSPCYAVDGRNSAPLVICAVKQTG